MTAVHSTPKFFHTVQIKPALIEEYVVRDEVNYCWWQDSKTETYQRQFKLTLHPHNCYNSCMCQPLLIFMVEFNKGCPNRGIHTDNSYLLILTISPQSHANKSWVPADSSYLGINTKWSTLICKMFTFMPDWEELTDKTLSCLLSVIIHQSRLLFFGNWSMYSVLYCHGCMSNIAY